MLYIFSNLDCIAEVCGEGWLSAFPIFPTLISFNPILIVIPMLAKHLFPFAFFCIDVPIPPISIPDCLTLNEYMEQLTDIVTVLSFLSHSTIVLTTQIYDTIFNTIAYTIVLQKTEINHTMTGLCVKAANKEHKV